ncbi:hypothetical protein NH340_JMT08091 [Sarcoptes scabiei]|nr:hypothetical protein NH340_JMT08091 [Sarcoptes scabiei]
MSKVQTISRLDTIYRNILLSKFFVKGWGDPENMKKIFKFRKIISNRETCRKLVNEKHPIYIDRKIEENEHYKLFEGHFQSPLQQYLSDLIPIESHTAYFQLIVPKNWSNLNREPNSRTRSLKPICLQLAGTGDHGFWRRRNFMAKPLIRDYGIGSIIIENPFYGLRKPKNQLRSRLNNVSDIFIMGGCLILESLALLHWAKRMKWGPMCITGISMGGHNASLAATNWHEPIGIVPCLSWTTASCVFTQGVMAGSIPWKKLEYQYLNYCNQDREDFDELIQSPENYMKTDMLDAGKKFAMNYNDLIHDESFDFASSNFLNEIINLGDLEMTNNHNYEIDTPSLRDASNFMRGIMDECTHLGNFSKPVDPEMAIIINAKHDGYVPSQGVIPLTEIWPGSTVRYLDRGHISAILFDSNEFRKAIADSIEWLTKKYCK